MAEFITSRNDFSEQQVGQGFPKEWWNIWKTRLWPYSELMIGDTLYWYDSSESKCAIVSKSKVVAVARFLYEDKVELFDRLRNFFGNVDVTDPYTAAKPTKAYCLAYKVDQETSLDIPKPKGRKFPGKGWLRLTSEERSDWFGKLKVESPQEPEATLDSYTNESDLASRLREVNEAMREVSPERRNQLVKVSVRNDSKIVKALKAAAGYRCQFPGCNARIMKKDGTSYVEVAHIHPVAKGGKSILGNLIVLCPNHHKEFDLGKLTIVRQTPSELAGHLNSHEFTIKILS